MLGILPSDHLRAPFQTVSIRSSPATFGLSRHTCITRRSLIPTFYAEVATRLPTSPKLDEQGSQSGAGAPDSTGPSHIWLSNSRFVRLAYPIPPCMLRPHRP